MMNESLAAAWQYTEFGVYELESGDRLARLIPRLAGKCSWNVFEGEVSIASGDAKNFEEAKHYAYKALMDANYESQ